MLIRKVGMLVNSLSVSVWKQATTLRLMRMRMSQTLAKNTHSILFVYCFILKYKLEIEKQNPELDSKNIHVYIRKIYILKKKTVLT